MEGDTLERWLWKNGWQNIMNLSEESAKQIYRKVEDAMSEFEKEIVCLPLSGAQNVRDLGGYRTAGGCRTKENVFVRAAKLDELTVRQEFLYRYGVRTVVDLRSAVEVQESPCVC
jgi:protein-tyrosine phosphatase